MNTTMMSLMNNKRLKKNHEIEIDGCIIDLREKLMTFEDIPCRYDWDDLFPLVSRNEGFLKMLNKKVDYRIEELE